MESEQVKMVIVMRNDLNMRKGKMVAQGGHASMLFLKRRLESSRPQTDLLNPTESDWLNGHYKKICVRADSEEELMGIFDRAQDAGLEVNLVTDNGLTEFAGPTKTCLAIGPDIASRIDPITSHLKLL